MAAESGPWPTVHGRFRGWRNGCVFTALPEGLVAEVARRGRTDLSPVSVDSTTVRAHHAAAGMLVGRDVMEALEDAAAEQEQARKEGAARRDTTGSAAETGRSGKNADASVGATGSAWNKPCSAGPAAG